MIATKLPQTFGHPLLGRDKSSSSGSWSWLGTDPMRITHETTGKHPQPSSSPLPASGLKQGYEWMSTLMAPLRMGWKGPSR